MRLAATRSSIRPGSGTGPWAAASPCPPLWAPASLAVARSATASPPSRTSRRSFDIAFSSLSPASPGRPSPPHHSNLAGGREGSSPPGTLGDVPRPPGAISSPAIRRPAFRMGDSAKRTGRRMDERRKVGLGELFLGFLSVSLSGFGGVLPWAHRTLVEERRWMREAEFLDMLSLCQFLPGPNIVNVSIYVGSRYHGPLGAAVAFSGLMLAPF